MHVNKFRAYAALALTSLAIQAASAVPIQYIYEGSGTGTLGGSAFTDASFTIIGQADTANIAPWQATTIQNTHLSTALEIAGLGTFAITTPSHTFQSTTSVFGGLGENLGPNWLVYNDPAFQNYDLMAIGPIFEDSPANVNQFNTVATTGGTLDFSSIDSFTFTAVIVPEPVTLMLLGLSVLLLRRR